MKTKKIKPRGLAERRARALTERKTRDLAAKFSDNPVAISEYLNDAFSTGDAMVIAKAIGEMVLAQGTSQFSRKSELNRENLYRLCNGKRTPQFETVMKAVVALDIQLIAKPTVLVEKPKENDRLSSSQ